MCFDRTKECRGADVMNQNIQQLSSLSFIAIPYDDSIAHRTPCHLP